jgi:hypothetical protein
MTTGPEPRTDVDLAVRVFGMSSEGRPFFHQARACNISGHGAKLSGIEQQLKAGDILGVQFGDKKARFRVIWAVNAGHLKKNEIGIQLLDGQAVPWSAELKKAAEAPPEEKESGGSDKNKRRFERHRLPYPLEIHTERGAAGTNMRTQTTDISGRGCYVETMLPMPVGTQLQITLRLGEERVTIPAVIRTCDGGVGMGIEFTGLSSEIQDRLQKHVEEMVSPQDAAGSAHSAG